MAQAVFLVPVCGGSGRIWSRPASFSKDVKRLGGAFAPAFFFFQGTADLRSCFFHGSLSQTA
jgi:hypothetical protein